MEPKARNRVALLTLAVVALAVGISGRLYQLGIERSGLLQDQARRQHERRVEVWGRRGAIVDRRGRELAVSLDSSSLFAHPHRVADPERAAALLAPVLGMKRARILAKLQSDEPFVWIQRRLDSSVANAVRQLDLPIGQGEPFGFETEAKRYYPRGELAIHVVGFTDIDQMGIEGMERSLDEMLRGDPTGYLAVRDGRGASVLKLVQQPARQPKDVVLTLDLVLQHIVERELDRAMRETGARWSSAVLLDPTTGAVLALANRPNPNPRRYGRSDPACRRNLAITDTFEPGSTFKIVTAAAALDTGRVHPEQLFDCGRGSIRIAGQTIGDHHPFGVLSVREILEKSSNVGMVRISRTLAPETLESYIRRFGFGDKTGIELPGESPGILAELSEWSGLSAASLSFGHEITATPLQMALAFAIVANDGVAVPPRIILGARSADGTLEQPATPEPRRVVSSRTAHTLASILEGVIVRGTGGAAAVPGYRVAGKTGTAQKPVRGGYSDSLYVASFGGFGSVRSPRVAGIVVLDSPRGEIHSGGAVAAPVFGRIMADALTYLRVPPDEDSLDLGPLAGGPAAMAYRGVRDRVALDTSGVRR
jgi:cell division protein FtsI/penicillin-binding protein 2